MELTPFDNQLCDPSLQMIKLLIPYLPQKNQRILAIYIKFIEFQNALSSFRVFRTKKHSTEDMLNEIRPYLPSEVFTSIDQILNMMSMMEMIKSMSDSDNSDPTEMLKNMLSPEQQDMFEMYNTMFSSEEGGNTNA